MKKPAQPKMIGLFVTLPQILLTAYLIFEHTQNNDIRLVILACINILLLLVFGAHAVKRHRSAVQTPWLIGIAVSYSVLIVLVALQSFVLYYDFPFLIAVAGWFIPIIYALLCINATLRIKRARPQFYIGLLMVPVIWFFAYNTLLGIRFETAIISLIIAEAYICLFLLIQNIIFAVKKKRDSNQDTENPQEEAALDLKTVRKQRRLKIFVVIFSLALPQIGLLVNNFGDLVIGNFSHPLFYIIPLVCSIMMLVTLKNKYLQLVRLFFIGVYAAYLVYFTVVFAPLLPLGIMGLAIFLGVLIFAPVAALTIQIIYTVRECRLLFKQFSRGAVATVLAAGFILLPACFGAVLMYDKHNFNNATKYIAEDTNPGIPVNVNSIKRSLFFAQTSLDGNGGWFLDTSDTIPFISPLYTDVVTGGALHSEMLSEMRAVFLDANDSNIGRTLSGETGTLLSGVKVRTTFDNDIGAYRSWIDLEMIREEKSSGREYVTTFTLPEGVYVSDMYLDIAGQRKMGILADDRAATQVYNDIVIVQRLDPAILHYVGNCELELRVFPFERNVPRTAGFEVIHNFDTQIIIDDKIAVLNARETPDVVIADSAVLISAALKETLPIMERDGHRYVFIVDSSSDSDIDKHIADVRLYADAQGITDADVIFASYKLVLSDIHSMETADLMQQCGFNLALSVRHVLSNSDAETIPIIVFVTGDIDNTYFPRNAAIPAAAYPESPYYYALNSDNTLTPYSFNTARKQAKVDAPILGNALSYRGVPVRDDGLSEVVSSDTRSKEGSLYADAISLDAALREYGTDSITLLRESFRTHLLSPQTAFIVVETYEQEQQLFNAQKQLLDEDTLLLTEQSLDETPLIVYVFAAAIIIGVIVYRRKRRKKGNWPI